MAGQEAVGAATPGPWFFNTDPRSFTYGQVVEHRVDGSIICQPTSSGEANGHLIAAAPGLRDALRELLDAINLHPEIRETLAAECLGAEDALRPVEAL